MIKRLLTGWVLANFVIVGLVSWIGGGWYLGWHLPVAARMLVELALITFPNLIIPILILRYSWPVPVPDIRTALGWQWNRWRSLLVGLAGMGSYLLLSNLYSSILSPGIQYSLPGEGGPIPGLLGLLFLLLYIGFVVITVTSEETMFRGWIQTQAGNRYGLWVGILLTALLFNLRHLPADIFYGQIWNATPSMYLSRQADLLAFSIILGLVRYFGRSTYASAVTHVSMFGLILVQGFMG